MDGVLSDAAGRQHHLERPRRDWDAFFEAVGEDALITEVARLLDVIDPDAARSSCSRRAPSGCSARPSRGSPSTTSAGICS